MSHGVEAGLGGAIPRHVGFAAKGAAGGNIDDSAATLGQHHLRRTVTEVGRRREVSGHDALPRRLPGGIVDAGNIMALGDAGIVDQHIQLAHLAIHLVYQLEHRIRVSNIRRKRPVTTARQVADQVVSRLLVGVEMHGNAGALLGAGAGSSLADTARGTGEQDDGGIFHVAVCMAKIFLSCGLILAVFMTPV